MQSIFQTCKALCSALIVLTLAVNVSRAEDQKFDPKLADSEVVAFLQRLDTEKPTPKKPVAERTSINNLKEISLGIMTYVEANKTFPNSSPAKEGGPAVSWRIKILPYIEGAKQFGTYNMDEPWDSDNNKKVLALMPAVYRHPKQDPKSTSSSYFALAGSDGILATGGKRLKIRELTDGLSKTVMIVEAEREIPWTKPEDIEVEKGKVPEFGRKDATTFDAATADGAAHTFTKKIDADTFWKIFTRSGGEVVNWDEFKKSPVRAKTKPASP